MVPAVRCVAIHPVWPPVWGADLRAPPGRRRAGGLPGVFVGFRRGCHGFGGVFATGPVRDRPL
eukprot:2156618-Lingulodinium_polyedra.AAC.1